MFLFKTSHFSFQSNEYYKLKCLQKVSDVALQTPNNLKNSILDK